MTLHYNQFIASLVLTLGLQASEAHFRGDWFEKLAYYKSREKNIYMSFLIRCLFVS